VAEPLKKFSSIACCGLDCCLCPSFQSSGASKCPGCMGPEFNLKHPSCGIASCCVKNKGFETCADCSEMPCERLKGWDLGDSFISHKRSLENLRFIKQKGLSSFLDHQKTRQEVLEKLLTTYNDGRSKSFYCITAALLPIERIRELISILTDQTFGEFNSLADATSKEKSVFMRDLIQKMADTERIDLKLRKH